MRDTTRPFAERKPQCAGCGHAPHLTGQCPARTFFFKHTCGCDHDAAYVEPAPSPNWRAPTQTTICLAYGCGHTESKHKDWDDGAFCQRCFDLHPNDDSLVEGGVYHRFVR